MWHVSAIRILAVLILSAAASAQLPGSYKLDGTANVVLKITGTGPWTGKIFIGGKEKDNGAVNIVADGAGWRFLNVQGNEGKLTQAADGNLTFEMLSGPNTGRKTIWTQQ